MNRMIDTRRHIAPDDPTNPWFDDGSVDYDRVQGSNPAGGTPYPKMLFRFDASAEPLHGVPVATMTVEDEDEEEALTADGWRASPALAGKAAVAAAEPRPGSRGARPQDGTT